MNNFKARFSLLKAGFFFLTFALLTALAFVFISPQPVQAGGTVAACDEANLLSALSGGGTVTFTCDGTITLTDPITIAANTTLDATGHNVTISGNNAVRIFSINSGINLNLTNLTIADGIDRTVDGYIYNATGGAIYNYGGFVIINHSNFINNRVESDKAYDAYGGAIYSTNGTITITDSIFSNNSTNGGVSTATNSFGGQARGGAIYSDRTSISITNTTFVNNSANGGKGCDGCSNNGNGGNGGFAIGGAIDSDFIGTLSIKNSTFIKNSVNGGKGGSGNNAGSGAPSQGGSISYNGSSIIIDNSTFFDNSSNGGGDGSGINQGSYGSIAKGGGIVIYDALNPIINIVNSTFSNNNAVGGIPQSPMGTKGSGKGGGIAIELSGLNTNFQAKVTNTTFFGNNSSSNDGGTFHLEGTTSGSPTLSFKNTIITNSPATNNCSSTLLNFFSDGGNNLQWPGTSCGNTIPSQDPKLGPLQNNGGPTQTHLPASDSPAIDAGNNATCAASPVNNLDQRGVTRPVGTNCDIGAVEVEACVLPLAINSNLDNGACGTLRYAVDYLNAHPNNTNKIIDLSALPAASVVTLSSSGLNLPAGVTIQGRCLNNKPDITITATNVTGNGLTLGGGNILKGLKVVGFGGKQIFTSSKGNQLSCVVASKT